jgi:hypothetical protein
VVVVDSPHRISPYGGVVAAPIFQRIATAALRQYGVPASINAPEPVLASRSDETGQLAAAGPVTPPPSVVPVPASASASASPFPDVTGLGARDALAVLSRLGLTPQLRGSGLVVEQSPAPGEPIDSGVTVVLTLERRVDRVESTEAP